MGIRDWLTGRDIEERKQPEAEQRSTLAYPDNYLIEAIAGRPTSSGQRVTVQKALGLSPVWSAVSIIAEQVGQLPLKVFRSVDDSRVEAKEHRAWRMLHDKPNRHTPADRFWSTVTTHCLLWGNAYIEKVRSPISGIVDELYLLDPGHMDIEWNAGTKTKTFVYKDPAQYDPAYRERRLTPDDVIHVFGLSCDGIMGESVIGACRNALGTALARDEFEGGFYARGATLSGVIEHPGRLGEDAAKNLKTSFASIYGGSGNSHQTAVLEEDAHFKPMTSPLRDLEFVAGQQLTRTDIAVMFRLPANFLGGSTGDSLTYATVEQNQLHFAQHTIAPWTNVIAKALSNDPSIVPQNVHYCEFTLEAMLRSDSNARATFYKTMHDMGAITTNEIRARENLPALPGGDTPVKPQEAVSAPSTNGSAPTSGDGNGRANGALTGRVLAHRDAPRALELDDTPRNPRASVG